MTLLGLFLHVCALAIVLLGLLAVFEFGYLPGAVAVAAGIGILWVDA
jgi:hypothetical protein